MVSVGCGVDLFRSRGCRGCRDSEVSVGYRVGCAVDLCVDVGFDVFGAVFPRPSGGCVASLVLEMSGCVIELFRFFLAISGVSVNMVGQ